MNLKTWTGAVVLAGGLALGAGTLTAGAQTCVPPTVDAADYFVNGQLDVAAYAAAVAAANAVCAGTGSGGGVTTLPATGSDNSTLLPVAVGLTALGGALVVSTAVRRRSTTTS